MRAALPAPDRLSRAPVERSTRSSLVWICFVVLAVKVGAFWADPYPSFHFGDSGAYLATALIKWIPPDRSFLYGFFLRPLVLGSHSLMPVILVQVALSAAASILTGFLLLRFFGANVLTAALFACLSSVEPIQLMGERFIMTEAIATFGFAVYVLAGVYFLRSERTTVLVAVQVIGLLLVSLRYSFIPLVAVCSLLLPLLAWVKLPTSNRKLRLTWLLASVVTIQLLFFGYRQVYGYLSGTQPAFLSRDGDFLVADMAPIVRVSDFPIATEREHLQRELKIPLTDIKNRRLHRWVDGGLCQAILRISNGDEERANRLAKRMALRAMRRDPFGVVHLAFLTYSDFLRPSQMRWALQLDAGHFVDPTDNDVLMIRSWFAVDARDRYYGSLTKRWEERASFWCSLMVLLPFLYICFCSVGRNCSIPNDLFLVTMSLCILASAVGPVEIANPRYLVPLPWLSILMLGILAARKFRSLPYTECGKNSGPRSAWIG